ncbi:MAG: transposon-transfer assisting family protein [Lachnospiraceae bacterium]|nr:transposon-transfer assisting family protein [Lachnospiraceae bacterium]
MKEVTFEQDELMVMAMFQEDSRSLTMERITEVIPYIKKDKEVYPLVVSTLEKMKRLSDTAFQSLDLEPYKEEPEDSE